MPSILLSKRLPTCCRLINNSAQSSTEMKAFIAYEELENYIADHCGQKIVFASAEGGKLKVRYNRKVLFTSVNAEILLHVQRVTGSIVGLAYDAGLGLDIVIAGAIKFIKLRMPDLGRAIVATEGRTVTLDLSLITSLSRVTEAVELQHIGFEKYGVEATFRLK